MRDYKKLIEQKIKAEEAYLSQLATPRTEQLINQDFKLSKTAQNCLNFITKQDEIDLTNTNQIHPDLIEIIKIVYILIKEDYTKIGYNALISHLISQILPKKRVTCLSKKKRT